ncbi:phage tail protein, partial [Escherichia coli]
MFREKYRVGIGRDKNENVGLGEGSALPVGVPIPWPSATPPGGWLKCNGATFD